MRGIYWVALELNYVLPPLGSSRDADFERRLRYILKSKIFAIGKIAKEIYSGNLSTAYYNKYKREHIVGDVYSLLRMDQLFQRS